MFSDVMKIQRLASLINWKLFAVIHNCNFCRNLERCVCKSRKYNWPRSFYPGLGQFPLYMSHAIKRCQKHSTNMSDHFIFERSCIILITINIPSSHFARTGVEYFRQASRDASVTMTTLLCSSRGCAVQ